MTKSREAWICDYVRTPFGRYGGDLSPVRTDDLGAIPLESLISRNPNLESNRIDEVFLGCQVVSHRTYADSSKPDVRNTCHHPTKPCNFTQLLHRISTHT